MPTAGTLTPPEAGAATSTLAASPVVCCLKLFAASSGTLVSVGSLMSYVPALLYFGLSIVTGVSNVNSGTISVSGSTAVTLIATTLGLSPGRSVVGTSLIYSVSSASVTGVGLAPPLYSNDVGPRSAKEHPGTSAG